MPNYQDYIAQVKENLDKQAAIFTRIDQEIADGKRTDPLPTKEEREESAKYGKAADEAEKRASEYKEFEEMKAQNDAKRAAMGEIKRQFGGAHEDPEKKSLSFEEQKRELSIGAQFVDNPQVKAYLKQIGGSGRISEGQRIQSPAVDVKTLITGLSSTSAGAFIITDRKPIVDQGTFYRPLTLLDLLTMGQTESDTVDYVREGTHTNNAAPIAEATATGDSSGTAPESAMVFAVVTENVKTIKHWIPASRQSLQDASQVRTLIDAFLRYGLMEELEDQVLNGSGSGQNFTGFHNMSGLTAQAWDTNILTTTRKARTKVKTTGRATPTAYLLNPTDWETLDLLQDNEARYFFGGPTQMGSPRLWGLPVVECEAQTVGQGAVTQWNMGIVWDRMQTTILASDSHQDFFIRGLVAILAEMRAAFTFRRPAAFVEIDLTA